MRENDIIRLRHFLTVSPMATRREKKEISDLDFKVNLRLNSIDIFTFSE